MKRVLLTGANGFIGSPCIKFLCDAGYEVHAISSSVRNESNACVKWHICDLLNVDAVNTLCGEVEATHLLHLAWNVAPGYKTSIDNLDWIKSSMMLLQAFYDHGGRRIAIAGTCFEYDLRGGVLTEEISALGPHTVYGAAKHTLYELVRSFAGTSELSYVWPRIFYLYGPGELPGRLVASVIHSIIDGRRAACSEGRQVLDFLHVDDVASALVSILDSETEGAINVGSGVPVSVRELVLTIADSLADKNAVELGAMPSPAHEPPVILANIDKLSGLGWQPKFDLASGLQNTCDWWKNSLQNNKD